jgi:hypothetical protein
MLTASKIRAIALMMEEVNTFEASVNFYDTTRRNILYGCHLHTRRRENLKSQFYLLFCMGVKLGLSS